MSIFAWSRSRHFGFVLSGVLALSSGCGAFGGGLGNDDSDHSDDDDDDGDDLPDNGYCDPVSDWDPQWAALEAEILNIVNERRSEGANCGSAGEFDEAGPLTMNAELRCAARAHSKDMADRGYFDHVDPDGNGPGERFDAAGYSGRTWGENIAAGNATAAATMEQWMNSDGHCSNIMNPSFSELGVGYAPGGQWGHLWTQAFGG